MLTPTHTSSPCSISRRAVSLGYVFLCLLIFALGVYAQDVSVGGARSPETSSAEKQELSIQAKVASGRAPLSKLYDHIKLEPSQIRRLPALSTPKKHKVENEKRHQIGSVRNLQQPLNIMSESKAYSVAEGDVRIMGVVSEGAASVRVRFTKMALPAGARVFVYSMQNRDEFYGPYEARGPSDDGTFWTPPMTGDGAVIEYFIPTLAKATTDTTLSPFEVTEINHAFADSSEKGEAGSCNYDVGTGYASPARAVGFLRFMVGSGEYTCTGTLLNTKSSSFVPYVITANHCFSTQTSAQSLRVYWNYNTGDNPPFGTSYTDGANLLATGTTSDFTFVRLTGNVPGGLWYNGWTTTMPSVNDSIVGIHHPRGSHKRISFGYINSPTTCLSGTPGPCANFLRVNWNYGVTEPGSSGSELLVGSASDPYYVGNLWGGLSSCSNPTASDWYGRFDVTYQYISSYLEDGCQASSITSPINNSTLTSSTVTFNWGPTCATQYYFDIGNSQGSRDIYGNYVSGGSTTVSGLPTDGRRIYVRLWSYLNGAWQYRDYSYLTRGTTAAQITSPANGSTFPSSTVTFNWGPVSNGVSYYLDLNSSPGSRDIYANFVSGGSTTLSGIPTDGRTIYVRLWSYIGGVWLYHDYTYKASIVNARASITSPANGSTFPSSTVTFNWTPVAGASSYYLDLNSSPGSRDIFANFVSGGSTTVSRIPTDGRNVYVRMWTFIGGAWLFNDYIYRASTGGSIAQIMSPANGSTFGATTITFSWNTVAGASQYFLDLSSSPGSRDIYANYVAGGSTTVFGIPADGRTIYVRLWTNIGGVWLYNAYTYTARR